MKRILNKSVIILSIFILTIGSLVFYLYQKRDYFWLSENKCITVWKTDKGAYIIPKKYSSFFLPKDNYILTTNRNVVTIIVDENSDYDYIIFNEYNGKVKVFMSKFKIKYYDYNQRDEFSKEYYKDNKLKPGLKCKPLDIGEL